MIKVLLNTAVLTQNTGFIHCKIRVERINEVELKYGSMQGIVMVSSGTNHTGRSFNSSKCNVTLLNNINKLSFIMPQIIFVWNSEINMN